LYIFVICDARFSSKNSGATPASDMLRPMHTSLLPLLLLAAAAAAAADLRVLLPPLHSRHATPASGGEVRFAVCGLRFAVCGLGIKVSGLWFAVWGLNPLPTENASIFLPVSSSSSTLGHTSVMQ